MSSSFGNLSTSLKVAELNTNPERSPRNDADALQRQRLSNLIVIIQKYVKFTL